jgi:NADH-quinone oxidoreductase subunit I
MAIAPLLRKALMVDLIQGLTVTFKYQDPKTVYTEQYPLERPAIAERYRGLPRMNVNPETGETLCIACNLCAMACPERLIVVGSERNAVTKRKEMTTFTYDISRCMFCGLCVESCSTDCLELSQDFEMATYSRENLVFDRARLEEGPEPKVYTR